VHRRSGLCILVLAVVVKTRIETRVVARYSFLADRRLSESPKIQEAGREKLRTVIA